MWSLCFLIADYVLYVGLPWWVVLLPAGCHVKAELRDFLRHRCGNLKAAFAALDSLETGQLSRHDFETSLQRLGYDANCAAAAFRDLDRQNAGVVNLRTFVNGLMSDAVPPNFETLQKPARHTYHPGMSTPRKLSDTALAPTLLQRLAPAPIAPITLAAPLTPKKGAERCPAALGPRGPTQASSASPRNHPLSERLRQLELQLASEQEARCNLEWRLTSQFREMIREEFQALRKQLAEDAAQQPGRFGPCMDINRRAKEAEDHEERRYVMMTSVSERRLDDTAPATGVPPSAASSGPTERERRSQELSKLQLTPRTSLRQENLSLREQILTLREQAIEAKEREAAAAVAAPQRMMMTRSHSDQMREAGKGVAYRGGVANARASYAPRTAVGGPAHQAPGSCKMSRGSPPGSWTSRMG